VMWTVVVPLALSGTILAVARTVGVVDSHLSGERPVPELSLLDRGATPLISRLIRVRPGTSEYRRLDDDVRRFYRKFNLHPIATLAHVVPAALIMQLAPLQFSRSIRRRFASWHRWSGRLIVALAVPAGLSGLYFGLLMPFSGAPEGAAIALFGAWFLFAIGRAFLAIRNGAVARHREWMLRMFAVALGVVVVRLVALPMALVSGAPPSAWFGQATWLGFALSTASAELWIRGLARARGPRTAPFGPPRSSA